MSDHEPGGWLQPGSLQHVLDGYALEVGVQAAPAGDAVDIRVDRLAGHRPELGPCERERVLHLTPDPEVPGREIRGGNRTVVQDRPFLREVLAGRDPLLLFI